jgi:dihydroorotate dehydrogenase
MYQRCSLATKLWGACFPNPVGLAAGFDKDGVAPSVWSSLGFGFAELGTVTGRSEILVSCSVYHLTKLP